MGDGNAVAWRAPEAVEDPLRDLLRAGAQRLIRQAVEAELEELSRPRVSLDT